MSNKLTTEQYIQKANAIHNQYYDYSLVQYINTTSKIQIKCPVHGVFEQVAKNHIAGKGCKKCKDAVNAKQRTTSLSEFIYKAKLIHFEKYDYSNVQFKILNDYVTINCHIHGQFKQRAVRHLQGDGCKKCARITASQTWIKKYGVDNPSKNDDIKLKRKQTWIKKYGVDNPSKNDDIKSKRKTTWTTIYGVDHPWKSQLVRQLLLKNNIEKYGVEYPNQLLIIEAMPQLMDFDWLYNQYITQNKTTVQIAEDLNISDPTVAKYLKLHEISIKQYQYSYKCIQWLESIIESDNIHIQHAMNGGEYTIPGTRYRADGYCQETNTIYEFHGDYWHGNPLVYESDIVNEVVGLTMGALYESTAIREHKIKELGYNLIVMWESQYKC